MISTVLVCPGAGIGGMVRRGVDGVSPRWFAFKAQAGLPAFSLDAFSLDAMSLRKRGEAGLAATASVIGSVLLSLAALSAGLSRVRSLS